MALTLHDDLTATLRGGDSLASAVSQLLALKLPTFEGILLNCWLVHKQPTVVVWSILTQCL